MLKTIKSEQIYKDSWREFFKDDIEFPDGSKGTYAFGKRQNGVGLIVITPDQKLLLRREYRYPIKQWSWEMPGGGIDAGETATAAAMRELEEETGISIETNDLVEIGAFYPLHSLSTENGTLFAVIVEETDLTTVNSEKTDITEELRFVPFEEVHEMLEDGRITDAATGNAVQIGMRKYENILDF
jgi:8-oxo-dGTP pyrophosphatase MutT (NUDIX family)